MMMLTLDQALTQLSQMNNPTVGELRNLVAQIDFILSSHEVLK